MKKMLYKLLNTKVIVFLSKIKCYFMLLLRYYSYVFRGLYSSNCKTEYPTTLQLPITYKCNFDCVMCGMQKLINKPGFSPAELDEILKDALFKKIRSVGVNGGEPFLLNNLIEYIHVIVQRLPQLKDIYIISNGYFTNNILEISKEILKFCHDHDIRYHLSISLDGYAEIHDKMRGRKGAFERTSKTCLSIVDNSALYCDTFGTICTVTKVNVFYLPQLEVWTKMHNIPISFNVATIHKRIENDDKYEDFSVFTDEYARMLASEFFYSKFLITKSEIYYGLYKIIETGARISSCEHKTQTVTLTPDGGIAYCATYSNEIGNAFQKNAEEIFFDTDNIAYRHKLHCEKCKGCSHYSGYINKDAYLKKYCKDIIRQFII